MLTASLKTVDAKDMTWRLADLPNWVWWLLALSFIAVKSSFVSGTGIYGNLGDADDATRLIQVRELMASWNWFDTTIMKMGGDQGMLSHWSRLIDLPIATLIAFFHLLLPLESAERLAHFLWPSMLLGALLWAVYRTTAETAGETSARVALLLAAMCPFAYYQFSVGRIDHHNAMIAAMVSAVLLVWSHPNAPRYWRAAGVLSGISLAIGYEALAPAVAIGVFIALWGLLERRAAPAAAEFAVALSTTFTLAFVATTAPSRWLDIHCDAISLNMVVLVVFSTSGLALALGPGRDWSPVTRLAVIGTATAVGITLFGMLEPHCLAGPKGQLPPLLAKVWLDNVAENSSFLSELASRNFEQSLGLFAFFLIAVAAQARRTLDSKSPPDLFLIASLVAFTAFACWQYKYMSYASFLAIVPISITITRLQGLGDISASTIRFTALVLTSQSVLLAASAGIDGLIGRPRIVTEGMRADANACSKRDALRDLDGIPPGLVASHIDIGAYIAALTPHRALAAPYHRIANAIIANHDIFAARDLAVAAGVLKSNNVDYIVICHGLDAPSASSAEWKGTLRAGLINDQPPPYLSPVKLSNPDSIFRVWRVDRSALNPQP